MFEGYSDGEMALKGNRRRTSDGLLNIQQNDNVPVIINPKLGNSVCGFVPDKFGRLKRTSNTVCLL